MKDKVNTDNFKKRKNSAYNATIKRIFRLMAKHRLRFAASICLAVAVVAATLLVPVLTGEAVDSIISEGNVDFEKLIKIILYIIILMFICAVSRYAMDVINNLIAYDMLKDIRIKAFSKLQKLPVGFIDSTSHGSIINRLINDVNNFTIPDTFLKTDYLEIAEPIKSNYHIRNWVHNILSIDDKH